MCVCAGVRDTARGAPETTETLCPIGTRTGTGLAFTPACPTAATWVVIGLKMPAGFWVTMVLVPLCIRLTLPAVGEMRAGLGTVVVGLVALKETAAMVTLVPTGRTVGGRVTRGRGPPGWGVEV